MRNDTPPSLASTRTHALINNVVVFGRVNGEGVYTTSTRTSGMLGEEFLCKREDGNRVDSFAMAVTEFKFRM